MAAPLRVIVMFGGGGALGAFGFGAWSALAPLLQHAGAKLIGACGTSIGAINAGFVARHGGDLQAGARALEAAWEMLTTPSVPFTGPGADRRRKSWNGVLTGLLVGNRALYHPAGSNWSPWAALHRREQPLMDRSGMWRWIEGNLEGGAAAGEDDPLLCVATVDIASGELLLFDNGEAPLAAAHFAASSAIPLVFEPVEVEGRLCWDGDMVRESALPPFLDRLRTRGRLGEGSAGRTLLVTIEQMCRPRPDLPRSDLEIPFRVIELLLHGKMRHHGDDLAGIDHVLHIEREPLPHDPVSGQFDYSPARMAELQAQGRELALAAWRGWADRLAVEVPPAEA